MTPETFFTKLYKLIEPQTWSIVVMAKDERLTITLSPDINAHLTPITISGRVSDFGDNFFEEIALQMQNVKFQVTGLEQIQKDLDDEIKKTQKDIKNRNKSSTSSAGAKKEEPKKEAKAPNMPILDAIEDDSDKEKQPEEAAAESQPVKETKKPEKSPDDQANMFD